MEYTMSDHHLARTTHTVELDQIQEINAALAVGHRRVTAGSVGTPARVAADSVLESLDTEGSPSYPYIFGRFHRQAVGEVERVELHTPQLRAISRALSLSQVWGV
jgi:hypothetical protein